MVLVYFIKIGNHPSGRFAPESGWISWIMCKTDLNCPGAAIGRRQHASEMKRIKLIPEGNLDLPMELRFPKARLFAYVMLTQGATCFSVLVHAISDAGLLSEDSLRRLAEDASHAGGCGSMTAAKKIISAFMEEKHEPPVSEKIASKAFDQIQNDVDNWYRLSDGVHGLECPAGKVPISCRDMAPIVLDLLLQQLMRH